MIMLLWDEHNKFVVDEFGEIPLTKKPKFMFEYESIRYVEGNETWLIDSNGAKNGLVDTEIYQIKVIIKALRDDYGVRVLGIDVNGKFLGMVRTDDERFHARVMESPPNPIDYVWDGQWVKVWFLNEELRPTDESLAVHTIRSNEFPAHPTDVWDFDTNAWVCITPKDDMKVDALKGVLGHIVGKIDQASDNRTDTLIQIIKLVLGSDQTPDKEKLGQMVDISIEEILNYCERPEDFGHAVMNLVYYT